MDNSDQPLWLYLARAAVLYWFSIPTALGVILAVVLGLRAFSGAMMKRYPGPPEQRPGYRPSDD